jgi:hypothetical protein
MLRSVSDAMFDETSRYVDRFGLLLLVTIGAVVLQSLIDIDEPRGDLGAAAAYVLITAFVGAMLMLSLRASGANKRIRRIAEVGVAITLVLAIGTFLIDLVSHVEPADDIGATAPAVAWMLMTALAPLVVIRRLIRHRRVTTGTLEGAIAAFLLIAVTFKFAFLAIDEFESTPFFGEPEGSTSFMYYSLVTVTTLGYGDLNAVTNLGRLASVTEAVIGQVFLVTFVAMLVGLAVQNFRAENRTD